MLSWCSGVDERSRPLRWFASAPKLVISWNGWRIITIDWYIKIYQYYLLGGFQHVLFSPYLNGWFQRAETTNQYQLSRTWVVVKHPKKPSILSISGTLGARMLATRLQDQGAGQQFVDIDLICWQFIDIYWRSWLAIHISLLIRLTNWFAI